ncbi:MAG: class I SAM-dependent methyltransferase [Candidatus Latescibacteria bacterium]|nr:class I SAM-dependent methyltransferase [Candidatus Latescibacterota bacterium]
MKKLQAMITVISLFMILGYAIAQDWEYDVPFVPTKQKVVEEMLNMAGVNENDILYDMGCGDGRIVITAAKEKGAHGVGIDIDPERIRESNENAEKAGVTDKVKFIEMDLFEADISEATVVSLYLLTEVNLRLRPKLLRELKPGTRVVSHNYAMGNWDYEDYKEIMAEFDEHYVYFWIVPANVNGTWEWTESEGQENRRYALKLDQKFTNVEGTITTGGNTTAITEANIKGSRLQFSVEQILNGQKELLYFEGKADGNSIGGTVKMVIRHQNKTVSWRAQRDPRSVKPIDLE